jgi:hypothetical protein
MLLSKFYPINSHKDSVINVVVLTQLFIGVVCELIIIKWNI